MSALNKVQVFNNLTRKKEEFHPLQPGKVQFYSCGPTTYDFLHVGNARALVVGDLIHRVFRALGFQVNFTRNFTDVDDKIIDRAKELKVDPLDHAERFVQECLTDMNSLGMIPATHTPKVSETIPEIIQMIQDLIDRGYAYVVDGEVLYHVPKFKDYGKLSKKDLESLQHGIRVEVDSHKKHPSDFVLWKPAKPGESAVWDSPWSKGRPGWHIECSAMAKKFLGTQIDLHHGGVDLMFPHHENEIAQSEAANGCSFSSHWCHNEFLNFGSEKMSKSLGNVVTIRQFCETYGGMVLRQLLCSVHYRSRMDWTDEAIEKAIHDVERIHQFAAKLGEWDSKKNVAEKAVAVPLEIQTAVAKMQEELANDFNVPGALGVFFNVIRFSNREFADGRPNKETQQLLNAILHFVADSTGLVRSQPLTVLQELDQYKAKRIGAQGGGQVDKAKIEALIAQRKEARAKKDWKQADLARDQLKAMGVEIKDNPDGSITWKLI